MSSTGSLVGFSEPLAGSTVTAMASAFFMELVIAVAVMLPSGSKRPLGFGTSSCITQIWHTRSFGTEGMFSATSIPRFSSMVATSALAPCWAHAPSSGIVRLSWTCLSGRSAWASSTWPVRSRTWSCSRTFQKRRPITSMAAAPSAILRASRYSLMPANMDRRLTRCGAASASITAITLRRSSGGGSCCWGENASSLA